MWRWYLVPDQRRRNALNKSGIRQHLRRPFVPAVGLVRHLAFEVRGEDLFVSSMSWLIMPKGADVVAEIPLAKLLRHVFGTVIRRSLFRIKLKNACVT